MIYPDEEKVTYGYNLGGQVDHVRGYKSYGYDYVNKIGYDNVRAAHLSEVLQRSGDLLQLWPCTQTFAEPRGEC